MIVEPGAEAGHLLGMLFLAAAAYGTLAVIGGGLYLAHRRAVRRRVERLIESLRSASDGPSTADAPGGGRGAARKRGIGR